jgi:hypothetical protein
MKGKHLKMLIGVQCRLCHLTTSVKVHRTGDELAGFVGSLLIAMFSVYYQQMMSLVIIRLHCRIHALSLCIQYMSSSNAISIFREPLHASRMC